MQREEFIQRSLGVDDVTVGTHDDKPSLKLIIYDAEFPDGTII